MRLSRPRAWHPPHNAEEEARSVWHRGGRITLPADRADPHAGVHLPVTGAAAVVLAATHLLDVDFLALFLTEHLSGDRSPCDRRQADLRRAPAAHQQHAV